jgi:hypothetical protein
MTGTGWEIRPAGWLLLLLLALLMLTTLINWLRLDLKKNA